MTVSQLTRRLEQLEADGYGDVAIFFNEDYLVKSAYIKTDEETNEVFGNLE